MSLQHVFLNELKDYFDGKSERIRHASTLANHGIRLHKQRLDKYGYQLNYVIDNHDYQEARNSELCSDSLFKTTNTQIPIYLTTNYIHNGQVVSSNREDMKFSACTEDLADGITTLDEDVAINCPNCGKAGTINSFRSGCSGCGTHFEMSDVYPSVGTYSFFFNMSMVGRDMSTPAKKATAIVDSYKKVFKLMTKIPTVVSAVSSMNVFGSWKEYQEFIKPYRPDFSYIHFSNAALSMMGMMLYSDAPQKLPFNKMANTPVIAPNLIDFNIDGFGLSDKGYALNGNIASVSVVLLAQSVYDVNGRVKKANERYNATFVRDITKPISHGFSFTRINCAGCGSVFDAMKGKFCPYCGNEYNLNNEEWVIVDMKKI